MKNLIDLVKADTGECSLIINKGIRNINKTLNNIPIKSVMKRSNLILKNASSGNSSIQAITGDIKKKYIAATANNFGNF